MGKKCIPGLFCIENMTLFLLFIICIIVIYLYYAANASAANNNASTGSIIGDGGTAVVMLSAAPLANVDMDPQRPSTIRNGIWRNSWAGPFAPSEVEATTRQQELIRDLPVPSRRYAGAYSPGAYSPIGVLTRLSGSGDMILPLMGRQLPNGRSRYQYYTMMTSGSANPPLPVSVNGKSCTSEYGCDTISNGDVVYVDGINDTFRATIYENDFFTYVPY